MKFIMIRRAWVTILMGCIVAGFSIISVLHIEQPSITSLEHSAAQAFSFDRVVFSYNNIAGQLTGTAEQTREPAPAEKNSGSGLYRILFFIMTNLLVSKEVLLMLISLIIAIALIIGSEYRKLGRSRSIMHIEKRYYLWWILKFLTPWQRYLESLAIKYDSNPLIIWLSGRNTAKTSPHSKTEKSAGFFYIPGIL